MKNILNTGVLILLVISSFKSIGQDALNVTLLNQQLTPGATRYSGSWVYAANNGAEYALLGANIGLVAFDLDNNFSEVGFVPGPTSNWREIMVIGDYAYVVTEGSGPGQGMQIVDLSFLPDSLHLAATYTGAFAKGHIIQKDHYNPDEPFLYVNGITPGGETIFLDVSDPVNPTVAGSYNPYYIHDCHVRGDTMFASAMQEGVTDIVDISDKSNPVLLQQIAFPGAFPHSSFTSKNNDFLFATDEIDGVPMRTFNISDFDNITEVNEYSADFGTLVHNPYTRGDFVFISHNSAGLRVLDVAKPDVPVEVGFYDTFSGPSGGSSGLWSACPFLPSGRIVGGDRQSGLFVWAFNNTLAGRIYGEVVDSLTQQPIFGATVSFQNTQDEVTTDLTGSYRFGRVPSLYNIVCEKDGYLTKTAENIFLTGGDSLFIRFELAMPIAVGVEDVNQNLAVVSISPNPFHDFLDIGIEAINTNDIQFKLFDSAGRTIFEKPISHPGGKVETGHLQPGVYFYQVFNKFGDEISTGKLVK